MIRSTALRALALTIGLASLGVAGCSASAGNGAAPTAGATSSGGTVIHDVPVDPANAGSVGLALSLPDGEKIGTVQWVMAGPQGASTVVANGSVDVHASGGTTFTVPLITAGNGYRIALSALSEDAGVTCEGDATFDVHVRQTTFVAVRLACSVTNSGGHTTLVNGTGFDCAAWTNVTASPIEVMVGGQVSLSALAAGPVPENITYAWSAVSGQFSAPDAADTQFTCTQTGPVQVTLMVADGPVPDGSSCNSALSTDVVTVTCEPPPAPAAPALPGWALLLLGTGFAAAAAQAARRHSNAAA